MTARHTCLILLAACSLLLCSASQVGRTLQEAQEAPEPEVDLVRLREFARDLDPELLEHSAPAAQYDSKYASPCWTDPSKGFRCLPALYLLGGFHSGLTSLCSKMQRLPFIATDSQSFGQFWAEADKPMRAFVDGFSEAAKQVQQDPKKIIMEGSQSTFAFYLSAGARAHKPFSQAMAPCWKNCSEAPTPEEKDECMTAKCYPAAMQADLKVAKDHGMDLLLDQNVPALMRAVYGDRVPKLVVVLRDPVDRLHSAFYGYPHYWGKHGRHPIGFEDYAKEQIAAWERCERKQPTDMCALMFEAVGVEEEKVFFHCDQLMRGMYAVFLERWLRFFPRTSLLILKAEDIFHGGDRSEPKKNAVREIMKYLGVEDDLSPDIWERIKYSGPTNSYGKGEEMLPEARRMVYQFYKPFNERLAKLLGDPSFVLWNQTAAAV